MHSDDPLLEALHVDAPDHYRRRVPGVASAISVFAIRAADEQHCGGGLVVVVGGRTESADRSWRRSAQEDARCCKRRLGAPSSSRWTERSPEEVMVMGDAFVFEYCGSTRHVSGPGDTQSPVACRELLVGG